MSRTLICIAVATVFAAAPVRAATWQRVTSSDSGSVIYMDTDSVTANGTTADAWFKSDKSKDATSKAREVKLLNRVLCKAHKMATVSLIAYAANGTILYSKTTPDMMLEFDPIIPDTTGEDMAKMTCVVAGIVPTAK